MKDWRKHVIEESEQLLAKIEKLHTFLLSSEYKTLDEPERFMLYEQYVHMKCYYTVLCRRIEYTSGRLE